MEEDDITYRWLHANGLIYLQNMDNDSSKNLHLFTKAKGHRETNQKEAVKYQ
jgi:hypothetical protein